MIRISGPRVRRLREEQELTQLYLATAVEVTTETISRWERKDEPTIKKENGLKLAEALGVSLEEILAPAEAVEQESMEAPVVSAQKIAQPISFSAGSGKKITWAAALLLAVSFLFFYFSQPGKDATQYSAKRIMPSHAVAGHPFPVVIEVDSGSGKGSSLLVKEQLPTGCRVLRTVPPATVVDSNLLKWIDKNGSGGRSFAYLAVLDTEVGAADSFSFAGTLLIRQPGRSELPVNGRSRIRLFSFHWADSNRDSIIDDEELLGVYDDFAKVEGLGIDVEEVESIWMGSGYRWNGETSVFEILP